MTFEVCDKPEDWERVNRANQMIVKNDELRIHLCQIIKAWDILKHGDYTRDIVETWLEREMKPAIDAARTLIPQS